MRTEAAVGESQRTRVAQGWLQTHAESGRETDPLRRNGQGRSVVVGNGLGQLKLLHRWNQVSKVWLKFWGNLYSYNKHVFFGSSSLIHKSINLVDKLGTGNNSFVNSRPCVLK